MDNIRTERAQDSLKCEGCRWAEDSSQGWCYMFKTAPEVLPCAQHDKFEIESLIASAIISKQPELLHFLLKL